MPKAGARAEKWIALLGRRDEPADGVEDYCTFLGEALKTRGVELQKQRVEWSEQGWLQALWQLWRTSAVPRGDWFLLQYTALGWSRRGFPFAAVAAVQILRRRAARCAVVFHEPFGLGGPRWIDAVRQACQNWVVHTLYHHADKSVFTVPLEEIKWLPKSEMKAASIPIGANVPEHATVTRISSNVNGAPKTVAIFCLSEQPYRRKELDEISYALRMAASSVKKLEVVFVGKGTAEAKEEIEQSFENIPVKVSVVGLRSAGEVGQILSEADAMLCVRGRLYPRRGSALAGIACSLPIIGYAGAAEGTPIGEAGVELVPFSDRHALGTALSRVLMDTTLQENLRERNRRAHQKYFSWDSIAMKFLDFLPPEQDSH